MTSRPNTPASPTPTPTPTPAPDTQPPTSTITSPRSGTNVAVGTTVTISGTAIDTGVGSVARVDVSVDGGVTYNTAIGTTTWSYNWTPTSPGLASVISRAVDTSGNQQPTPQAVIVTVVDPGSPLKIVMMTPESGATGVSTGVAPMAMFSKSLNLGSLRITTDQNIATILLLDASNTPVRLNLFVDVPTLRVIPVPQSQLQPGQAYTVIFKGGPNEPHITDEAGMPLVSDYIWSFTTAPGGVDPQIVSATPAPGDFFAPFTSTPTATFSEPLDPSSVNNSTVMLVNGRNNPVPATVSYDASAFKIVITPANLLNSDLYTVTLKGGASAPHITDAVGTPLAFDYTWTFATSQSPPPLPMLVITATGNNVTQYYQEILRAEGFSSFNAMDINQITSSTLAQYDVAILSETPLTPGQVTMLSDWVTAGGNLIAMRPDKRLAPLLGITDASAVQSDAYFLVDAAQEPGAGIVDQAIQYHGPADLYTLNGATAVASIYSNPAQGHSNPAVTLHSVGTNGGQAAAFTFDLARSIVYTMQGNPAWVRENRGGMPTIRTDPPFDGGGADYQSLDKAAIPQSGELQRLLSNMILSMNGDRLPLPRFWYFPGASQISAQQSPAWLDGRNSSSFGDLTWNGTRLAFSITVGAGANLHAMIPNQTTGGNLISLAINGSPVGFTVETIEGRSYAVFPAANGNAVATYAP